MSFCVGAANAASFSHSETVARAHCAQGNVISCIHRAALHYGVDFGTMKYIARRESRFDPSVCNSAGSGACGLFQFMPGTWASTPMSRRHSVFSAKWCSLGAAWYMRRYGYGAWGM